MARPSFLVDVMLQKLGRWLRILGAKAEDPEDPDDDAILFQAKSKNLTVLTMDEELARRAKKLKIVAVHLPTTMIDITEQLSFLVKKFKLPLKDFEKRLLCTMCGGDLEVIPTDEVEGLVPPSILKRFKEVWRCKSCGHVYWAGSHWKKIGETISRVKAKVRKSRRTKSKKKAGTTPRSRSKA
jgi:hypothetical protein